MKEIDNAPTSNQQSEVVDKYANQAVLPNVDAIPDLYFTRPTSQPNQSFVLAPLPNRIAQQMGCVGKHILIRYKILKRNRDKHSELVTYGARRAKRILDRALYHADAVQPGDLPTYRLLVSFKDPSTGQTTNAFSTVNVNSPELPNYVVVVDWFVNTK